MCFFQGIPFEMYTSSPRLKGDYRQPDETNEQYRKRMHTRRRVARERNMAANAASRAAGKIIALRRPLKAAESFPIAYESASNSWRELMVDWLCPNPENIFCVEIPDEIEAYENWELWRYNIEVLWPDEPDWSNPPSE